MLCFPFPNLGTHHFYVWTYQSGNTESLIKQAAYRYLGVRDKTPDHKPEMDLRSVQFCLMKILQENMGDYRALWSMERLSDARDPRVIMLGVEDVPVPPGVDRNDYPELDAGLDSLFFPILNSAISDIDCYAVAEALLRSEDLWNVADMDAYLTGVESEFSNVKAEGGAL